MNKVSYLKRTDGKLLLLEISESLKNRKSKRRNQSGISLNLGTGQTGHATLFNQWEGALLFKSSTKCSKIFHNGGRRRTEHCYFVFLLTDAKITRLGFTLFREKIWCKRIRVWFIAGIVEVLEYFRGRGFSGMACKIFDRSKFVPCKNSCRECMKISYKTGMVPPINFYRTRIKDQVIMTRIKSNSNVVILLVLCCQHTWTSRWCFFCLLWYPQG